jgi:iron(III) transport system substrate-binding protein
VKPWREKLHQHDGWTRKLQSPLNWIVAAAVIVLVIGGLVVPAIRKLESIPHVTIYTSQDQVYAEQLFREFTAATGIEVRAVYDSETVKTVGIANRLYAEKSNPHCDVFWNNEEFRTRQLAAEEVFVQPDGWTSFGYRSRRLVINTNLVQIGDAPSNFADLTNQVWRGKFALAYPLFGMTATHFMALRDQWGDERWREWCQALLANQPMIVDGNSVVVRQVARGEVAVGMTDFDDIAAGRREGYPIAALPISSDALLVPNTVALVANSPNLENGKRFIEWLTQPTTVQRLVELGALEGVDPKQVGVTTLSPDWNVLLLNLKPATDALKKIFLR